MHRYSLSNTDQRRISPLTIENMEKQGATSHRDREPLSPNTTMGEVGSNTDVKQDVGSEQSSLRPDLLATDKVPSFDDLVLPEASLSTRVGTTGGLDKPAAENQTISTPPNAKYQVLAKGLGDEPSSALKEATNKLESLELALDKETWSAGDRTATPKPTPAKVAPVSAGVEIFPMSPEVLVPSDPFAVVSSPLQGPIRIPSIPSTRRTSNAGSLSMHGHAAAARMPPRRMSTAESSMTGMTGVSRTPLERESSTAFGSLDDMTVYSEATKMRFNEDDRLLERFVSQNEPDSFVKQSADQIPTEVDEALKHGSYSFVCSFGWVGEEKVDLEETPLSRESYIEKLDDAKDGIRFVVRAIINYQTEINSRGHHKFKAQFLSHQNQACIVVLEQLDEIEAHINEVIQEIQGFGEDDAELKEELARAYSHALPWVKRTRRLVSEAHVFYKLNYVLGRQQKTTKVKRALPTIPAGRAVPNSSLERK